MTSNKICAICNHQKSGFLDTLFPTKPERFEDVNYPPHICTECQTSARISLFAPHASDFTLGQIQYLIDNPDVEPSSILLPIDKKICYVCGCLLQGILDTCSCSNGSICENCKGLLPKKPRKALYNVPVELIKNYIDEAHSNSNVFLATTRYSHYIEIDDKKGLWRIPKVLGKPIIANSTTRDWFTITGPFPLSQIEYIEINEDGRSKIKRTGLARAAVGGLLFGGAGAIVGALTGSSTERRIVKRIDVLIFMAGQQKPITLNMWNEKLNTTSEQYIELMRDAEQVIRLLEAKQEDQQQPAAHVRSGIEEIIRLKELLDQGAISADEYEKLKSQIINS